MIERHLSKSAKKIQDFFIQNNLDFKVIELPDSTRTAKDAAQTLNCSIAQIVKSIIFQGTISKKPILVLASGINKINESNIEKFVKEPIQKATPEFTKETTGFAIGGVPPVGHLQNIQTFIDEDLFKLEELWAAAGTSNAVFRLRPQDLLKLSYAKVINIAT